MVNKTEINRESSESDKSKLRTFIWAQNDETKIAITLP